MSTKEEKAEAQCATMYVFPTMEGGASSDLEMAGASKLKIGNGGEELEQVKQGSATVKSESQVPSSSSRITGASPMKPRKKPLLKSTSLGVDSGSVQKQNQSKLQKKLSTFSLSEDPTSSRDLQSREAKPVNSSSGVVKSGPSGLYGLGTEVSISSNFGSGSAKVVPRSHKGHYRSVSHGGGVAMSCKGNDSGAGIVDSGLGTTSGFTGKPSALKKGHTRAASQGQIVDQLSQGNLKGHVRATSKTDFILPPGHAEHERPSIVSAHWRGHSRQASRSESIYTLRQQKTSLKNKLFFWRRDETENPRIRAIVPNHLVPPNTSNEDHPNGNYPSNHIRTTKYTTFSFLPKNLFEQFHRFANLYFISIVLLNWIPAISAFGKEIAMLPVMFVLGVTAIKDLFEDRRRYNSDKRINNSHCRIWKR